MLLNARPVYKIAGPEWLHTPIPKCRQLSWKSRASERDSIHAPSRLLSEITEEAV